MGLTFGRDGKGGRAKLTQEKLPIDLKLNQTLLMGDNVFQRLLVKFDQPVS